VLIACLSEDPPSSLKPAVPHSGDTRDLWEQIGFHKPVAGFWYNLILFLLEVVLGIFLSGALMAIFYPFPESNGYNNTVGSFFGLLFFAFDVGTHLTMDRFITESRIKDPRRMVKYIQYFIWYQMITGMVQVTIVGVYALYIAPGSDLAYLMWLMLILSTKQYPGFLGVFSGVLNSLQHYDKNNIINFTQGQIIQRITELGFVYLGKMYGQAHPEVGVIMGIAIGASIGTYVDDFIGVLISAYFFGDAMKSIGIRPRDCFRIEFDWALVKETFSFGLKTSLPGLLNGAVSYYILLLWLNNVPQYVTFVALQGMAAGIGGYIGKSFLNLTPLYSESYLNGKKRLSQYLLGQSWRYSGQMAGFFFTIFTVVYFILPDAFLTFGIEFYMEAIPFILPSIAATAIISFINPANQVLTGADKPNVLFWGQVFEQCIHIFLHNLFIIWWALPTTREGLVFSLVFTGIIGYIIKDSTMYLYVQLRIFKIKIPVYQTFIAPGISACICILLGLGIKALIYDPIFPVYGFYIAIIGLIPVFIFIALFLYLPLTGFFGGWDNENVAQFEKVVAMSGPSKWVVFPMFRVVRWFIRISPLHDRFGMDSTAATEDALDLYRQKMEKTEILRNDS
jgi:hypothetical protein